MIHLSTIAVLAALCGTESTSPAATIDDSVLSVAAASLPSFLASIPVAHEARYGFDHRGQFARARLGEPLPVLEGPRDAPGEDSSWSPRALGRWRVPVLVDGRARAFLTVERSEHGLDAVDFGGTALAREIDDLEPPHRRSRKALLRLDRLGCDILVVDRQGRGFAEGQFLPLRSARERFASDTSAFHSRKALGRAIRRHQLEAGRDSR